MRYRQEIDGLRAVAVLPVILFHAGIPLFGGGYVGVDVFFVISGYLITSILLHEQSKGAISYPNFVARRARRILPALLSVMLVCAALSWALMTPMELRDFGQSAIATLLFSSNILFWIESGYFAPAAELKPLLHTWSLAIEEQFYLIFPFVMILCLKRSRLALTATVVVLTITGLMLSVWWTPKSPTAAFYLAPTRAWAILVGVLCAIYLFRHQEPTRRSNLTDGVLAGLGLLMLAWSIAVFDAFTPYPGYHAILPVIGAALIIVCARAGTTVARLLSLPVLVWTGLLSYSLYLWHQPVLAFGRMIVLGELEPIHTLVAILATLVLSCASWALIEKPFRYKKSVATIPFVATTATISLALLAASLITIQVRGETGRYDVAALERLSVLRQANRDRQDAIRADECHYNNLTGIGLDRFLAEWQCTGDRIHGASTEVASQTRSPEQSQRQVIAVAGDSHSADLVVALRQNDINPVQIGGAGCSLDPAFMGEDCRHLFDELFAKVQTESPIDLLYLANRYEGNELSSEAAARVWEYWSPKATEVIVFTGAVEFPLFDRSVAVHRTLSAEDYENPHAGAKPFFDAISALGAQLIDRKEMFCRLSAECHYRDDDGELLMVDPDHLSIHGARAFGREWLATDPFLQPEQVPL